MVGSIVAAFNAVYISCPAFVGPTPSANEAATDGLARALDIAKQIAWAIASAPSSVDTSFLTAMALAFVRMNFFT